MDAKRPEISVVIACYNDERYILDSLKSLLFQTYTDFEVIVVDDGSTDSSSEIVSGFISGNDSGNRILDYEMNHERDVRKPRFRLFRRPHEGISAARNFGISKSRGKIIAVLDSDDEMLPGSISSIHSFFSSNPRAGLAYSDIEVIGKSGSHICFRRYHQHSKDMMRRLIFFSPIVPFKHSAISYRKELISMLGGYSSGFKRLVDVDMMYRATLQGKYNLCHLDAVTARFRRHESSVTNSRKTQMIYWKKLICLHYRNQFARSVLVAYRSLIETLKSFTHKVFYALSMRRR